jgi:hypothetical protein
MTLNDVREIALSFKESEELPHFERTSFRVRNKIFATLDSENDKVCLMLSVIDQNVFATAFPEIFNPLPNAWGKKGATYVNFKKVRKSVFKDAVTCAYCKTAPKNLGSLYLKMELYRNLL